MSTTEFQVDDIVEVLNLNIEQAKYFSEPNIFIGMRYRIEKIWPAGYIFEDKGPVAVLVGFPMNAVESTTFFEFSQLLHYTGQPSSNLITKKK